MKEYTGTKPDKNICYAYQSEVYIREVSQWARYQFHLHSQIE